jgi:prepilin-type processing-associated H-X9-DG protein/prepilin-type N-terminal cleavage/methylation domain-containing protein
MSKTIFASAGLKPHRGRRAVAKLLLCRSGFTLVELLVVIGIIGILIAILLPALSKARTQAQLTACCAKLQQIMVAAQNHRNDHQDYYPLCGVVPAVQPETSIGDPYAVKYDYLSYTVSNVTRPLAPITQSLAVEMSNKSQILVPSNSAGVLAMMDPTNHGRNFTCPAQGNGPQDLQTGQRVPAAYWALLLTDDNYAGAAIGAFCEPQSYIWNEAVLGCPYGTVYRLSGHGSEIRQAASTLFCCDGNAPYLTYTGGSGGSGPIPRPLLTGVDPNAAGVSLALATVYNTTSSMSSTLFDAWVGNTTVAAPGQTQGGVSTNVYDKLRHNGKINIAFCDGHVETKLIPRSRSDSEGFWQVFLLAR